MLTCKNVTEQASDYLEGPTTFGQRLSFRMHLFICKHCRRYIDQLKVAMGVARGYSPPPVPSDSEIDVIIERLNQDNPGSGN